jgi:undecaprenyl-diphosphatase
LTGTESTVTYLQAVALGVIQGLTEFLPISSTAHLKVIPVLLDWKDPGAAFTAVIQWGTWFASVLYFWDDIQRLTVAFFRGLRDGRPLGTTDARLAWMIVVGTVPIVVFGLLLEKQIKGPLRSLYVIAGAAVGLALVLAVAEWRERVLQRRGRLKDLEEIGWGDALLVGFAQVVAVVPGASRSGVTITGGLFAGLSRPTAARFSFLLSLPSVFGAGVHQLWKERHELLQTQESVANLVIATVVSGVVGYAAIAFLLHYLRTHTTWVFIGYRLALGAALLVLLRQGVLEDKMEAARPPRKEPAVARQREAPVPARAAVNSASRRLARLLPDRTRPLRRDRRLCQRTPCLRARARV